MSQSTRKVMAIILASTLIFNLLTLVHPGIAKVSGEPAQLWVKKSSTSLSAIAYGNGIYVALTNENDPKIVTSTDLVNWVEQQKMNNQTKTFRSIEFINGQFVIGTNYYEGSQTGATLLFSPDGVTWTGRTIVKPAQYSITSVAYGNGKYVASSFFGELTSSTDGITWTTPVKVLNNLSKVQFINGHFVGAGYQGMLPNMPGNEAIVTSTDGLTWKITKLGSSMTMGNTISVASDGVKVMTASAFQANRLSASDLNQPTIPVQAIDSFKNNYFIKKMTHADIDGGLFVVVGTAGKIQTSADTVNWTDESISGASAEFLDVIEAGNSAVAVGANGVYQRSGQAADSVLTPNTGSFDKKASAQSDVTTTLSLNGNTLSGITNGGQALQLNTDYTVSGSLVTIKKTYLASQPIGSKVLTFQFSGGADQTLTITIGDTTPNNSAISPTTAGFDKKASVQSDVTTTLSLNGNTLSGITNGGQALQLNTDYRVTGNSIVTIKKEYLASQPIGSTALTFQFSGGADQTLTITIKDTTPNNSVVSPTTGSFDKKASAQSDVTTTLSLNGNTLSGITNGGQALQLNTDYTVSGDSSSVTIKKEYLAGQPNGSTALTFQFSAGGDQTLTITISDTTPNNSVISPTTASFDKEISAQLDIKAILTLNGNTLSGITNGSQALQLNTDYTVADNSSSVKIKKAYLASQPVGTTTLTFHFSSGADQTLTITISDTTPNNSVISPTTANFDKETSAQSDVTTTLSLNGNTLNGISQGAQALELDTDYTVSGDVVTIKKEYLALQPEGPTTLTFHFSSGADQTLTITISDATSNNSVIAPTTANFDKEASAQPDVTTTLSLKGNTLSGITQGGQALELDTDYTVSGDVVTIKKEYLALQSVGTTTLTFHFSSGTDQTLTITISDGTPNNSVIAPTTASFDNETSAQSDVATTLSLNGNALSGITQDGQALKLNTDYTVAGNTVTIKKEYLALQQVGTIALTFHFSAGTDQTLTITVVNTTVVNPPNSGDNGPSQPTKPSSTPDTPISGQVNAAANIYVNGQVVSAGTATEGTRNNQSVMTIVVDQAKLAERLAQEGQRPVITILLNSKSDIAVGQLTGNMVKDMENKQATLELKTDKASYFLPASQIDIDGIQRQLGSSVSLQDVIIHIEMAQPVQAITNVVENAAKQGAFTLIAPPVDFTVSASYGERIVEVTKFSAYVKRQIALPEGTERSGITTGIVVEADGSVRHVPTKVTLEDGQYYAQIKSLTNSTYAVVWHPIEFGDVASHWAKNAINDLGSRMIVDGKGDGNFHPGQDMTRAEFAAILVRGLGLKLMNEKAPFSDVNSNDWYNSAVGTAHAYQLISGFEDGTFKPDDKLTRQQAMVMISKAMKLTQLKEKLPVQAADELLQTFGLLNASEWAKQSIADCIQAKIVVGQNNNELAVQANITRAEVALMIQRLLQISDLI